MAETSSSNVTKLSSKRFLYVGIPFLMAVVLFFVLRQAGISTSNIIVLSFNSLSYAALLFLLASGLSLIFGVMRIVNLAHAAFFLLAGYIVLEFYNVMFGHLSLWPRLLQLAAWAAAYLLWRVLEKAMGGGRALAAVLGLYLVSEILTSLLGNFLVLEVFFPKVPIIPVGKINFGVLILALAATLVVLALSGMVIERFFLRRLGKDTVAQVLVTIGFAFILQDGSLYTWGGDNYMINQPWPFNFSVVIAGLWFPMYRTLMILSAVTVALVIYFSIERTRLGAIMRATVDDPEMARGIGINTNIVSMSIFAIGAALAGTGGVIGSSFFGVYPGLDFEVLPYAFAVVIIGGMGTLAGVIVGSIVVGFMDNFGTALFPELSYFALFAPMAIILAIKPTGLFGRE